MKFSFHKKS